MYTVKHTKTHDGKCLKHISMLEKIEKFNKNYNIAFKFVFILAVQEKIIMEKCFKLLMIEKPQRLLKL